MSSPQWTEQVFPPATGRDHLGLLEVSSGQILPSLSPGIIVMTSHPRYHSLYAFILQEFWERDLPRTPKAFQDFYRPIEFVFSVGVQQCERPTHGGLDGVVGSQRTSGLARANHPAYDPTTSYIDTPLGGYGLYYRGVMAEMGFIIPGGLGMAVTPPGSSEEVVLRVDVPTPRGTELAYAFRQAVADTAYYRHHLASTALIPREVVKEFGEAGCLCALKDANAPDRALLVDQFLHAGIGPDARRATFRFFVDLAAQTHGFPVDSMAFRRLAYSGKAGGLTYTPRTEVASTHRRWQLYQTREYYAFALNTLWAYLCAWGLRTGGDLRPIAYEAFFDHLRGALDFQPLAEALGSAAPGILAVSSWQELQAWLEQLSPADAAETAGDIVDEHRLFSLARKDPTKPVGGILSAVALLALVASRFGKATKHEIADEWEVARMGDRGRLSLHWFLRDLAGWDHGSFTIEGFAQRVFEDYVIRQHLAVARGKLPENTFRFDREDGGLRFYRHSNPVGFADSRFDAISGHLHELGFCTSLATTDHTLTADGQSLLDRGDVAWTA